MRSTTKTTKRPLALATQTIRTLDLTKLTQVVGGVYKISVGLCD